MVYYDAHTHTQIKSFKVEVCVNIERNKISEICSNRYPLKNLILTIFDIIYLSSLWIKCGER